MQPPGGISSLPCSTPPLDRPEEHATASVVSRQRHQAASTPGASDRSQPLDVVLRLPRASDTSSRSDARGQQESFCLTSSRNPLDDAACLIFHRVAHSSSGGSAAHVSAAPDRAMLPRRALCQSPTLPCSPTCACIGPWLGCFSTSLLFNPRPGLAEDLRLCATEAPSRFYRFGL